MNASPAIVMDRARVLVTMAQRAELVPSVCLGIASTAIVAAMLATDLAWRVRWPNAAADLMANADRLPREPTRTTNARTRSVMVRARVSWDKVSRMAMRAA